VGQPVRARADWASGVTFCCHMAKPALNTLIWLAKGADDHLLVFDLERVFAMRPAC